MGSRGASANVGQQYTGISAFSEDAFQAGNDARADLIRAINKYNLSKGEYEMPIKSVSKNGEKLTLGNNKKVNTIDMLGKLGVKMP